MISYNATKCFIKGFVPGFIFGYIFKTKINKSFDFLLYLFLTQKQKVPLKEQAIFYLICKITDYEKFNEIFPTYENTPKVQPMWDYYENKGIIKIKLEQSFNETISYNDFLNNTGLDIPLFQSFSEIFNYIH